MSYDLVCKYLAEAYPTAFVQWLLGIETQEIRLLKTELNVKPVHADSLLFLQVGQQILHLEFQTTPKSDPPLPLRMLDYSVRLKRKYRSSVTQIIIFLSETTSEVVFTQTYDDETTTHHYRVVRLWEQDPNLFIDHPGLLPFAVLTKSNSPESLLTQVAQEVNNIEDSEQQKTLTTCASLLAGLRFDKNLINSLFRKDIMQESVIYRGILEEGKQEEALSFVLRLLKSKFGTSVPTDKRNKLETLTTEELEDLGEALLNFSTMADLDNWLENLEG